jgi:hypothetical protein
MNDFLFAHKKTFTNEKGQILTVTLDANLKKNILTSLQFDGDLAIIFKDTIALILATFLNKTLDEIPKILISNSLPLWLFYSLLDEYQGHIPVAHDDLVCLCFGITKSDLSAGIPQMAGRACGSCLPYLKKREFKKIDGLYPGPLVVKLDDLKNEWAKNQTSEISEISIEEINGLYLEVKIKPYNKEKLQSLSDYFYSKLNTRFFLRATL